METTRNELPMDEEIQLSQMLQVIWRRRWLFIAFPTLAVLTALLILPFLPRLYEATSLVRIRQPSGNQPSPSLFSAFSNLGISQPGALSLKTVERLTKTRSTVRLALTRLRPRKDLPPLPRPLTEEDVLGAIETKTLEPDLLEVSVRFPEPRWAAAIANAIADALAQRLKDATTDDAIRKRRYLERHLQSLQQKLEDLDSQIALTKKRLGFTDVLKETEALVKSYYDAELQRVALQAQLQSTTAHCYRLRQQLIREQPLISVEVLRQDPTVQEMRKQLAALEIQRADYLARYTPEHTALQQLNATIKELRQNIAQRARQLVRESEVVPNPAYQILWEKWAEAESQRFATEARLQGLDHLVSLLRQRLANLPDSQRQFAALMRHQQMAEQVYANLLVQLEVARIQEETSTPLVVVADYAVPPKSPVSPRRLLTLCFAALLGTIVGVLLTFASHSFAPKVYDPEEVRQILSSLPTVTLPAVRSPSDFFAWINSRDPAAEAIRLLRTNLQLAQDDQKPLRCLLVTSPNHGEGKTFVATALATTFAQAGHNTILVSGADDEGQPHPLLGIAPDTRAAQLPVVPTNIRRLQWLAVTDNSVDAAERFLSAVKQAKERADIVVIDAPPVLSVADTSLLIPLTEGVIVVAEAGRTRKAELQKAKEQIQLAKGRIVAVVLNKAT